MKEQDISEFLPLYRRDVLHRKPRGTRTTLLLAFVRDKRELVCKEQSSLVPLWLAKMPYTLMDAIAFVFDVHILTSLARIADETDMELLLFLAIFEAFSTPFFP